MKRPGSFRQRLGEYMGRLKLRFGNKKENFKPAENTLIALGLNICPHGKSVASFQVIMNNDQKVEVDSSPFCPQCTADYFNKYSTTCAVCKEPIVPSMPVAMAPDGLEFPYVHLLDKCCEDKDLFCGRWGEGELVPLHEFFSAIPEGILTLKEFILRRGLMDSKDVQ